LERIGGPIVIPRHIWRALGLAIKGRRASTDKFARQDPAHPGNAPHVYFVDLSQDLADRFARCMSIEEAELPCQTNGTKQDASFANRFDALNITDLDSEDEVGTQTPHEEAEQATPSSTRYEALVDPAEKAALYMMCLYEDADEVSNYVISLWDDYFSPTDHGLDIGTVAFLTDAALSLFGDVEVDAMEKAFSICSDEINYTAPSTPSLEDWGKIEATLAGATQGLEHDTYYVLTVKQLEHRMTWARTSSFSQEKAEDTFLIQYLMDDRLAYVGNLVREGVNEGLTDNRRLCSSSDRSRNRDHIYRAMRVP